MVSPLREAERCSFRSRGPGRFATPGRKVATEGQTLLGHVSQGRTDGMELGRDETVCAVAFGEKGLRLIDTG